MDSNETTQAESVADSYAWQVGEAVRFRHVEGAINFVSDEYITVCMESSLWKSCVLVYPAQYGEVVRL